MTTSSDRIGDERHADRCRRALSDEQARSLAETDGWAHVDKERAHADWHASPRDRSLPRSGDLG